MPIKNIIPTGVVASTAYSNTWQPSIDRPNDYAISSWDAEGPWADFYANGGSDIHSTDLVAPNQTLGAETFYFYADLPNPSISSNGGWEFSVTYMDDTETDYVALDSWFGSGNIRGTCYTGIYWVVYIVAKGSADGDKLKAFNLRWIDFDAGMDVTQGDISDTLASYLVR